MAYTFAEILAIRDQLGLSSMSSEAFSKHMTDVTGNPADWEAGLSTGFGKGVKHAFHAKDMVFSPVTNAVRQGVYDLGGTRTLADNIAHVPGMLADMALAGAAVPAGTAALPAALISGGVFGAMSAGHTYEQTNSVPIAAAAGIGMGLVPLAGVAGGALVSRMLGRPAMSNALAMGEGLAAKEGLAGVANAELSANLGAPVVDLLKGGQSLSPGFDFATRLGHETASMLALQTSGAATQAVAAPWGQKLNAFADEMTSSESWLTNALFQAGFGGVGLVKSARGSADHKYLRDYGKTLESYLDSRPELAEIKPTAPDGKFGRYENPIMEPGFVSPARIAAHEANVAQVAQRVEQVDLFPTEEARTDELDRLQGEHDAAKLKLEQHRATYDAERDVRDALPDPERIAAIEAGGKAVQTMLADVEAKASAVTAFKERTVVPRQSTSTPLGAAQALHERMNPVEGTAFLVDANNGQGQPAPVQSDSISERKTGVRLASKSVEPRPLKKPGRDQPERDAWDAKYEHTHNHDGTPIELSNLDQTMRAIGPALRGLSDEQVFLSVGDVAESTKRNTVGRLLNAGWVWDPTAKRMVNPENPSETPLNGLERLKNGTPAPTVRESATVSEANPFEHPAYTEMFNDETGKLVVVGDRAFAQVKEGSPWATVDGDQAVTSEMLSNFLVGETVPGLREASPMEVASLENARRASESARAETDANTADVQHMAFRNDGGGFKGSKDAALGDLFAKAVEKNPAEVEANLARLRKEHVDMMRAYLETKAQITADSLDGMDAVRLREVYERKLKEAQEKSQADIRREQVNKFLEERAKAMPEEFQKELDIVTEMIPQMGDNAQYAFSTWMKWAQKEGTTLKNLRGWLANSKGKFRGTNKGLWGVWGLDEQGLPKTRQAGEAKRGDEQFYLHKYKTPKDAETHRDILNAQLEPGSKLWEVRRIDAKRGEKSQSIKLKSGAESALEGQKDFKEYHWILQKEVDHVRALEEGFDERVQASLIDAAATGDWVVQSAADKEATADYLDALVRGVQMEPPVYVDGKMVDPGSKRIGGFSDEAIQRMFGDEKQLNMFHAYVLKRFMNGAKGGVTYDKNQRMKMYLDSYEDYFSPKVTKDIRARKLIEEFTGGKLIPMAEWQQREDARVQFMKTDDLESTSVTHRNAWVAAAKKYFGLEIQPNDIPTVNRFLRISDFPEPLRDLATIAQLSRRLSREPDFVDPLDVIGTPKEDGAWHDLDAGLRDSLRSDLEKQNAAIQRIMTATKGLYTEAEIMQVAAELPTPAAIDAADSWTAARAKSARVQRMDLGASRLKRHAELESRKDSLTPEELIEARRLTDEAAREAGFNVGPVWHWSQSDAPFNVFDLGKAQEGFHFGTERSADERAVEFSRSDEWREGPNRTGRKGQFYLKGDEVQFNDMEANSAFNIMLDLMDRGLMEDSPNDMKNLRSNWNLMLAAESKLKLNSKETAGTFGQVEKSPAERAELIAKVDAVEKALGRELKHPMTELDSLLGGKKLFAYTNEHEGKGDVSYAVANPEQIKSADPFTGVSLDRRFSDSADVRYMAPEGIPMTFGDGQFMLIGRNSLRNNPDAQKRFDHAEALKAEGKTPEEIMHQTGLIEVPDGTGLFGYEMSTVDVAPRLSTVHESWTDTHVPTWDEYWAMRDAGAKPQEYDIYKARLTQFEDTPVNYTNVKVVSDLIDAPKLFRLWPALKYLRLRVTDGKGATIAKDGSYITIGRLNDQGAMRDAMLHEIQHYIQKQEGFLPGTQALLPEMKRVHDLGVKYGVEHMKDVLREFKRLEATVDSIDKDNDLAAWDLAKRDLEAFATAYPESREAATVMSKDEQFLQYRSSIGEALARRASDVGHLPQNYLGGEVFFKAFKNANRLSSNDWLTYQKSYQDITGREVPVKGSEHKFAIPSMEAEGPLMWGETMAWNRVVERLGLNSPDLRAFAARLTTMFDNNGMTFGELGGRGADGIVGMHAVMRSTKEQLVFLNANPAYSKYVRMFSMAHEVNGHGFFEMVDKAKLKLAQDPKYDPMPDYGVTRRQVEQTEEFRRVVAESSKEDMAILLHQMLKALPKEFSGERELGKLFDLTSGNPNEVIANFNAIVSLAIVADHTNAPRLSREAAVERAGNRVAEMVRWLPKPIADMIVNFAKWARPFFRVITGHQNMIQGKLAEGLSQPEFAKELHGYLGVLSSIMKVHEQNTKAALDGQRWVNALTPGRIVMEQGQDKGLQFTQTARMELGKEQADFALMAMGFVGPERKFEMGPWDRHYGLLSSLMIKHPELREVIFDATFNEMQRNGGMFDFFTALGQQKKGVNWVSDEEAPVNIVANNPALYKLRDRLQLYVQKEPEINVSQLYAAKHPDVMKIVTESGLSLPQVELVMKSIAGAEDAYQLQLNWVEKQRIEIAKSRGAYILMSLDSAKSMSQAKIDVNNYVTRRRAGEVTTTGDVRIDNVLNQMLKQIDDSMKSFRLNKAYVSLARTGPIKVDVIWKTKDKARDVFDAHSEVEFEKKRDAYLANPDVLSVTRRVEKDKDLRFNTDSIHELHETEMKDSQQIVDMVMEAFGDNVNREQLQKIVDANSTIGQYVAERIANQMDVPGPERRRIAGGMEGSDMLHQQVQWAERLGRGLTRALSDANFNLVRISPELKNHPAMPTIEQAYRNFKQRDPAGVGVVQNVNFAKALLGNFTNMLQDSSQPLLGLLPGNLLGDPLNSGKISAAQIYGMITKALKDVKIFHTGKEKLDAERKRVVEEFRRGNVGLGHAETVENTEMLAVSAARRKAEGFDPGTTVTDFIKQPLMFLLSKGKRVSKLFSDFGETATMLAGFDFYKKLGYDYDTAFRYAFDMTKATNGSAGKMGRAVTIWNNPDLRPVMAAVTGLQNYANTVTSTLMHQFQRGFLSYGQDSLPMRKKISNILGRTGELSRGERVAAQKAFVVGFGTMLSLAGVLGIPGVGALLKIMELAGYNAKEDLVKGMNALDPTDGVASMLALHGGANAIGFDVGARMGVGGMLGLNPYSGFDAAQIFGVTGGVVKGAALGAVDLLHGRFGSAAERNLPNMLARPLKMWRDDWEFRDGDGTKMLDTSTAENVMYSVFGVKPNRLMQVEELRNIQKADSAIRKAQNTQWVDEQAVGLVRGEVEQVKAAIDKRVADEPGTQSDALMELIAQQYVDRTFPYNPSLEPGARSPLMAMMPGGKGVGDNVARLQTAQNVKLMLGGKQAAYLQPKQDKYAKRVEAAQEKLKREELLNSMLQGGSPAYLNSRTQPSRTQTPRNPYERAMLLDQMLGQNPNQSVQDLRAMLR